MAPDTDSEGTFCCGLPNPFNVFKKKTEEPGPIRQAVDGNNTEHRRNRVLIDDDGHPIDDQGRPVQGSILHQHDAVGGDISRITSFLAPPADLYGQAIPLDVLTPPSAAAAGPSAGASGACPASIFGGPSHAGASGGGTRPVSVFAAGPRPAGLSGGGPPAASEVASSEDKDGKNAEKKDHGNGNLAAAANLI